MQVDDLMRFHRSCARVKSHISHFQLRNLVWATSKHDVFMLHEGSIKHWNGLALPDVPMREVRL